MSEVRHENVTSRRNFLRKSAVSAAALPALASAIGACSDSKASGPDVAATRPTTPDSVPPNMPTAREKADTMDAMHEKGIKAFPAKTAGKGNQPLTPRVEKGVKVFELDREEIQWEVEPGRTVKAWAYNGQVPGPQIRVRRGRPRTRASPQRARRIHVDPLPRPRAAERPGRRAVHHATAGQARRELHLRVHGAQCRLAHVPLAPQRRDPGGKRAARRVRRRAEAAASRPRGGRGLRHGAERRLTRLHAQRKELPGDGAADVQAGPDGADPIHERGDDDPPHAPPRQCT